MSEYVKAQLDEIECLKPKKRRHIDFLKARWIYQLEDTDIYLIYLTGYTDGQKQTEYWKNGFVKTRLKGWVWHKVKKDRYDQVKSIERIDFYEVMDDVSVPTEILFHINELSLLKATDDKEVLLKK